MKRYEQKLKELNSKLNSNAYNPVVPSQGQRISNQDPLYVQPNPGIINTGQHFTPHYIQQTQIQTQYPPQYTTTYSQYPQPQYTQQYSQVPQYTQQYSHISQPTQYMARTSGY